MLHTSDLARGVKQHLFSLFMGFLEIINAKGGVNLTNIIDGMDEARFRSANPVDNKLKEKKLKEEEKKMPIVLRNLKNGS